MTTIDADQLLEYGKALKDYKKTGVKQCLSIVKSLLEADISLNQLKETKIGSALSKIAKDETNDSDEKELKDSAILLFKKCKQRDEKGPANNEGQKSEEKKVANGGNSVANQTPNVEKQDKTSSPEKKNKSNIEKESVPEEKKIDEIKPHENKKSASDIFKPAGSDSSNQKKNSQEPPRKEPVKESVPERKKESVGKVSASKDGVTSFPALHPTFRNKTLEIFSDGLLTDYKGKSADKDRLRPVANKVAIEVELAIWEKVKANENGYRMEARNISSFLGLRTNAELRKRLIEGTGNVREFVENKEKFLNQSAKEKLEENSRRMIDAANADYDKKIIRESDLYQCKKCKSRRVTKTEKQTRSGDEPMTSFFQCVDCGKGWKEG